MKIRSYCFIIILSILLINCSAPYKGLIGYYKLDGNAIDSSSFKNHGANTGASASKDRFNDSQKALYFDGKENVVTTKSPFKNSIPDSFSVVFWANPLDLTVESQSVISQFIGERPPSYFGSDVFEFGFERSKKAVKKSKIYLRLFWKSNNNGRNRNTTSNFFSKDILNKDIEGWHQWSILVATKSFSIYKDSTLLFQRDLRVSRKESSSDYNLVDLNIGGNNKDFMFPDSSPTFFKGVIDDVKIYNTTLKEGRIKELFDGLSPNVKR